jgi:hypothetical protein
MITLTTSTYPDAPADESVEDSEPFVGTEDDELDEAVVVDPTGEVFV